jgi:hypothetical protein
VFTVDGQKATPSADGQTGRPRARRAGAQGARRGAAAPAAPARPALRPSNAGRWQPVRASAQAAAPGASPAAWKAPPGQVLRQPQGEGRVAVVQKGEVVGLLGPNGAGKTTSFYMIVGLVRSDGDIASTASRWRTCRSTAARAWACLPAAGSLDLPQAHGGRERARRAGAAARRGKPR